MTDGVLRDAESPRPVPRRMSAARLNRLLLQAAIVLALLLIVGYLAHNVALNIERLHIRTGFDFLARPAGFEIAQHLIPYSAQRSSYIDAFTVALINTVALSLAAIALTTPIGFVIGLARLSSNPLVAGVARAFVDVVRNVPFLLQLFFWYFTVLGPLPPPRQSLSLFGVVFANRRGLYAPSPVPEPDFFLFVGALAVGVCLWFALRFAQRRIGVRRLPTWLIAVLALLPALGASLMFGAPVSFDVPVLQGFNFSGGMTLNPEFVAMLLALAVYNAAFIAELVRGGVLSVPKGQVEAGSSLGLRKGQVNWRIVMPLALRVIVPPLGSQYIQLLKSSSLGAAIAYPDLMLVFAGTTMTQTNQPIEIMGITMATYLLLCLLITVATNVMNRRVQLVER